MSEHNRVYCEKIPIVALNLKGELLAEFESIQSASKALFHGKNSMGIWSNLIGHILRSGKYHFVTKEVYNPSLNYSYKFRKNLRRFKRLPVQNIIL